jgi:fructan beta-fructosidase
MKNGLTCLLLLSVLCGCHHEDLIIIEDFEGASYGQWTAEGEAFGKAPGENWMVGSLGRRSAMSTEGSGVGTLTSPSFSIERRAIHFLMGSIEGYDGIAGKLSVQLLVDDRVVRTTVPGRFHAMFWESWDVAEYKDREARIRVTDQDPREWALICMDQIIQSSVPAGRPWVGRTITVTEPMMNFPVKNGAPRHYIELLVDGQLVRAMDVELAADETDYWVVTDLTPWLGKEVTIRTRQHPLTGKDILDRITVEEDIRDSHDLYRESLRPQFHFSSKRGWLNDPNGLVYYDGEYHLYYQHNPFGWDHSRNDYNKTWGHAVSTDLVHWQELPAAIHPDHLGTIYSGSAVVDHHNSAGFQAGEEKTIVALYTSAGGRSPWSVGKKFSQSLAYSNDRGRTFTPYPGNPVVPNLEYINRDPKVIWHEPTQQWVMVLHFHQRAMGFFTSDDLQSWELQSKLEVDCEDCPELFQLPLDGTKQNMKWILYGGSGNYFVGEFDGRTFTPETGEIRYSYGNCFYASQTFNNLPETDGRRIQMAWGAMIDMPGMPFNQQMLFPVELTLHTTDQGVRMFANPVREIEGIQGKVYEKWDFLLDPDQKLVPEVVGALFDIATEFEVGQAEEIRFMINGIAVEYHTENGRLMCDDREADLEPVDGKVRLRILVDRTTMEIFANDGRVYMPMHANADMDGQGIEIISMGGQARISSLVIHELKSIWN